MSSDLNNFLLNQLNGNASNKSASKYSLPKFQTTKTEQTAINKSDEPIKIDQSQFNADLNKIRTGMANVGLQELSTKCATSSVIDLTTALRITTTTEVPKPKSNAQTRTVEKFDIAFIDCDKVAELDLNEYCQLDVSKVNYNHLLHKPSSLGRVICMKYRRTTPFKIVQKVKTNTINVFKFDTKSPDDIVQEALERNKTKHLNSF